MQEYIFRGPNGRFCETFAPTTSLCEVYETLSHRVGAKVAGLLVGFPPQSVPGETLEGVETNEVITIVEGQQQFSVITIKEEPRDESECSSESAPQVSHKGPHRAHSRPTVLDAKRLIAAEIGQQKIAQKVICKVILGVSQGRLCQLMQDTAFDNMVLGEKPYPNKSCEHYHKIYEFLTTRSIIERHNLYCSAAWGIERERQQKKHSFSIAAAAAAAAAESPTDARNPIMFTRKAFVGRGKRTFISNMAKKTMEHYFVNTSRFITQDTRAVLAKQLNLPEETVQFYFKNLRAREKKGSFIPDQYMH
ncbi:uncharacterized protein LOC125561192 [Nematostella vectensis]|uniref:uncharacterized protein LOC125561192 n=1 Tax=Nematostella vectensis TaxID=45351 RepID=UPI002077192B|nr:uncharacterized protein LOC125561192 [Nematostella vectensis]